MVAITLKVEAEDTNKYSEVRKAMAKVRNLKMFNHTELQIAKWESDKTWSLRRKGEPDYEKTCKLVENILWIIIRCRNK